MMDKIVDILATIVANFLKVSILYVVVRIVSYAFGLTFQEACALTLLLAIMGPVKLDPKVWRK